MGLGTIVVRHDGQQVVYKVLVYHVVRHSRPASVRVTFVFFYKSLLFCNKRSSKPRRSRGTALVRGIRFQFFPTGVFWFFVPGGVTGNRFSVVNQLLLLFRMYRWFMLAAGARPKETKVNLMGCICLCSEVEINIIVVLYMYFQFRSMQIRIQESSKLRQLRTIQLYVASFWLCFIFILSRSTG